MRWVQDVYFASFQEIINVACTYPGVALLGIKALGTDQLSGSDITVDCIARRETVPVWDGSAYVERAANNPAWTSYYLLNRYGEGVDASRIDYQAFYNWSLKCLARGYTVNLYVDSTGSLRRALDMVSLNGRASVVQMGSKFTCLVDLPDDVPVQRFLFTMGNIAADSFSEEWMPVGDRANAIEVTYWDKELDYTRQTVEIYSDDFDTSPMEINKVSVTKWGCTDRAYAEKYGRFLLACNRYLTLTSSWNADVDAIACIPGDPIDVAHDVPQWGQSGRIVSYDWGLFEMILDREVTLQPATDYVVMIRRIEDDAIDIFAVEQVGVETTTDTLTATLSSSTGGGGAGEILDGVIVTETEDGAIVTETEDGAMIGGAGTAVYAGSVYSFGLLATVVKPMRVLNISRASDLRKKLACIEYTSDVYVDGVTY
jgi:predicted phage tail protein